MCRFPTKLIKHFTFLHKNRYISCSHESPALTLCKPIKIHLQLRATNGNTRMWASGLFAPPPEVSTMAAEGDFLTRYRAVSNKLKK